jgi:hypothetical protein
MHGVSLRFSYIYFNKAKNRGRIKSMDLKVQRRTTQHRIKLYESLIFLVIHRLQD